MGRLMDICPYCGTKEYSGSALGGHIAWCYDNPNSLRHRCRKGKYIANRDIIKLEDKDYEFLQPCYLRKRSDT
jgi:hypothetical protein